MLYKNILLIDDDSEDADIFKEAVHSVNSEIVCHAVTNPLRAFEELLVTQNLPDVVFVDFNMPALNGAQLIQKMKAENRLQNITFVLMSSHSEDVMNVLTEKFDKVQYIIKPSSFHELIELLDTLLR